MIYLAIPAGDYPDSRLASTPEGFGAALSLIIEPLAGFFPKDFYHLFLEQVRHFVNLSFFQDVLLIALEHLLGINFDHRGIQYASCTI